VNFVNKCLFLLIFVVGCATENYEVSDHTFKDDILKIKKASYRSKPELMSKWSEDVKPYLLLCDDFVSISDAEAAIRFWENLGYEFRNTRMGDPLDECMSADAPFGAIRVKLPTSATASILKGKLAVTSTVKYIDTNTLYSATITIHGFALKKRYTLEHEIGHALGWGHVETTGHIMNPKWINIGSKAVGVRHDCYSFSDD
tara:strand:- start:1839 stop:2441 length:603 start_codon:yes stop_codon:yes gene_type:complete